MIWLMLVQFLSISASIVLNAPKPMLEQCLAQISENHFDCGQTVVHQTNDYTSKIQNKFLISTSEASSILIETKTFNAIFEYETLDKLNETFSVLSVDPIIFNSRAKYVIIAQAKSDLIGIADILWSFRLYKSVILLEKPKTVNVYEMKFKSCGDEIQVLKIDSFNGTAFKKNQALFQPDMKKQFYNCHLGVVGSPAYTWMEYDENNQSSGVFPRALNLFAETNGLVLEYRPENQVYADELQQSFSFETVHADIERGYADVFLALGNNLPYLYFDMTFTLYDDNLYWIVPKAEKMPYWKAGLTIFSPFIWMVIGAVFVITNVAFLIIAKKTNFDLNFRDSVRNVLYLFAVLIGFPNNDLPSSDILKITLMTFTTFCFFVNIVFQAKLYSVFTDPLYENDITNLEMLIESGLPMIFRDGLAILFINTGPLNKWVLNHYVASTVESFGDDFFQLIEQKNFATITDTGVLIMHPNLKKTVNIFDVARFQSVMYMRKRHELFELLHREMKRIVEHGFMEKMVSDAKWGYSLKDPVECEEEAVGLSLQHLHWAFVAMMEMYCVCIIVFIFEIIWDRFQKTEQLGRLAFLP